MEKIYLSALIIYSIFVAIYFLRLKAMKKQKKDIVGKGNSISELGKLKTDIVGKSRFDPLLSPSVITSPPKEENKPSVEIPPEELDEVFSDTPPDEDNEPMDIDYPLEYDTEEESETEEEETEEVAGTARAGIASGVHFEELANMVQTVNDSKNATSKQKEQAGYTLLDMRQTDMFERLVSGSEEKFQLALQLIDIRLNAYYKELEDKSGSQGGQYNSIPPDFKTKDFFY